MTHFTTPRRSNARQRRLAGCVVVAWAAFLWLLPNAACAQDAAALKALHAGLQEKLANNQFQRPLYLESTQNSGDLKGDVYAVVDQPFSTVEPALQGIDKWCDLLILHLNVKRCTPAPQSPATVLSLVVGRKFDQPVDEGYKLDFDYKVASASADFLRVQLDAADGPLGTKNYRIVLEAIALDDKHSFLHMSYAYGFGFAARMAMEAYLGTVGRDKVGFTIVDHRDGKPVYVGSVRGVLERNTMRYYLAIESYLGAYHTPASQQTEKRLSDWYAASERYPMQLHEMERGEYMEMKRREVQRQNSEAGAK